MDKRIDFSTYDETYYVEFANIKNGDTIMDYVFSKGEAETDMFVNTLMENITSLVDKDVVLVNGEHCNIFINGIVVKDLSKIGIVSMINNCSPERLTALRKIVSCITGGDVEMILSYEAVELSDEEMEKLIEYFETEFEIKGWDNMVKNKLYNYFAERKIKDIHGEIIEL